MCQFVRMRFHEALMVDYFDMTREEMIAQQLYFIGWGFSYQATDSQTNVALCDFKFKSSTINQGQMFDGVPGLETLEHGGRRLQDKIGHFFRTGFNYMRAFETLRVNVKTILDFDKFYHEQTKTFLPKCPPKVDDPFRSEAVYSYGPRYRPNRRG